ncbi:TonB-dependent siderophore receptor [Allosphingosinicella deserti]|uniref:TonB-dependent receptor n=1 Tax=Allosphingosinicella deserti TaxID=2116704 RepID=A0A2P7QK47_9SPHN|nr:TonB-dependent receptor [Sphingomonas deserti]PSJ38321.1 TonB-dependent receptor [Sphingomonas deserti]
MMRLAATCTLALFLIPLPALAQRADDNAIADAEDAFGSNDGGEDLGLYGPFDVRGFSPIDAGNVRVEGIFIDRQADFSHRLVEGNRIRVGPSAADHAFPAPSGIVDYRLRTPGNAARISTVAQMNSFGGALVEIDAALPLAESLGIGGGFSRSHSEYASGNNADITNIAAIAHWRPAPQTDMKMFWSRTRIVDEDIFPIIIGDGSATPPRLVRRRFLGQPWADVETERFNYGAIGRTSIGGFSIRGGVFRSVNTILEGHSVFLRAAAPGEAAGRVVSAYPGRNAASTSGELGIAREFSTGRFDHRIQVVARGRRQARRYGGAQRLELTPAPFGDPLYVERPGFIFASQSDDRVRQWSLGLGYQARIRGVGQVSGGLQKISYRKAVTTATGPRPVSRDEPWLFNLAASGTISRRISVFASTTRGLEESDVAPEIAVNRDEAPPALRTRQFDAGVKIGLGPLALIAGAFEIRRPYYGVDRLSVFRQLGVVRHRGLEASLTGSPFPGLTLVAGGTLLRARLSGEEVLSGAIGNRPVDVPSRKVIASADWRLPSSPTSIDLAVEHIGPNVGDARNRVRVAAYTTLDLGIRHRISLAGAPAVLRLQATNLFDAYGWEMAGDNAFVYTQGRQVVARLAVDF